VFSLRLWLMMMITKKRSGIKQFLMMMMMMMMMMIIIEGKKGSGIRRGTGMIPSIMGSTL
jgi:hypothetical protein